MQGRTSSERKDLKRIIAITLVALTLVILGAVGLIAYAAAGIDRVQAAKERELAQIRLGRMLDGLTEDINSSAIWNDSVITMAGEPVTTTPATVSIAGHAAAVRASRVCTSSAERLLLS